MILLIVTVQCSDTINSNSVMILLIVTEDVMILLIVTVQCSDTINSNSAVILLIAIETV